MSKLQELIQRLCPDGVEYKKLGEVAEVRRGVRVVKQELAESGNIPVYQNSLKALGYYSDSNSSAYTTFIIAAGAAGDIGFSDEPFWAADDCFVICPVKDINDKYVYYCLQNNQIVLKSQVRKASIPRLSRTAVEKFVIPVPPLEVQEEIVRILDRFDVYAAELQAELQARKEQYEYYRNLLLTFNPAGCAGEADDEQEGSVTTRGGHSYPIQWKTMGEVGTFIRGNGLQKKDFTESGVGCIHYGQIYTYYGTFTTETKSFVSEEFAKKLRKAQTGDLVIATTSENVEDVGKAVVWLGKDEIAISGDAYVYKHNQNPRYIAYLLQTDRFLAFKRMNVSGTKVTRISGDSLAKYPIPIPPLELQEKIVAILDRFETLVNDLSEGLPAEIAAVKEQYEYYRNRLLTFKEKTA